MTNFDYTSAHARVFDGIRNARYRAFSSDASVPEICDLDDLPAAALWVHAPSGKVSSLCRDCVDTWLDNGDEAGDEDPPALIPLRNRRRSA